MVLALLIGLFAFLFRGKPAIERNPAELLPAETALLVTWDRFRDFVNKLEEIQVLQNIQGDRELAQALAQADTNLDNLAKKNEQPHYQLLQLMARDLTEKWLGREVSLAIIPPPSPNEKSAVLFIARTEAGFEKNLAEWALRFYPKLSLKQENYKDCRLYAYEGEKPENAFAFCRLDQTVVVSIRSPRLRWLKLVVDRYRAGAGENSLAQSPLFQRGGFVQEQGLTFFLAPEPWLEGLRYFPSEDAQGEKWAFWLNYFETYWKNLESIKGRVQLGQSLRFLAEWQRKEPRLVPFQENRPEPNLSEGVWPESVLSLAVVHPEWALTVRDLYQKMKAPGVYGKEILDFQAGWKQATGQDFEADFLPNMGEKFGLLFLGLNAGGLFPMPRLCAWMDCPEPAVAQKLQAAVNRRPPPDNPTEQLLWGAVKTKAGGRRLGWFWNLSPWSDWPDLAERETLLPEERGRLIARGQVDFSRGFAQLRAIQKSALWWSAEVRRQYFRWQATFAALRHFEKMDLECREEEDGGILLLDISLINAQQTQKALDP